jgi:glycosyltransferase involved in cell wall biosynthesis
MPRVSVIIPTYNCAAFLDRGLASVMQQTYRDYEIIVADDGSTDDTAGVVAKYAPKVRRLWQENRGVAAARNLALSAATGEFIAYIDADDKWYPTKLARQVSFLDEHPSCGFVHTDVAVIDERDEVIHEAFNRETGRFVPQGRCLADLLRLSHIQLCTVMERRAAFRGMEAFDERLHGTEDYYRWIVAAMEGLSLGYLDEPLALYRWRRGSLSRSRSILDSYVRLFELVLKERRVGDRFGEAAGSLVAERLWQARRHLAQFDLREGRRAAARRAFWGLAWERPFHATVYRGLAKAYLPPPVLAWVSDLRHRKT